MKFFDCFVWTMWGIGGTYFLWLVWQTRRTFMWLYKTVAFALIVSTLLWWITKKS